MKLSYDIIIIGGGLVGETLACLLAATPVRVALIDQTLSMTLTESRPISLSYRSYQLLHYLHLWSSLADCATPIEQVHVSEQGGLLNVRLRAKDLALPRLGYVIPADQLAQALQVRLAQSKQITQFRPARLLALRQHTDTVTLDILNQDQPITLTASLVVGADGTYSTVRKLAGIEVKYQDKQRQALVATVSIKRDHQNTAYERFVKQGVIAMVPQTSQQMGLIWTGDTNFIESLRSLSDQALQTLLQQQFSDRLGELRIGGNRHYFPLSIAEVSNVWQRRVALIGNAAHTVYPIAAQGLNIALREIMLLAELLQQANWQASAVDGEKYQAFQKSVDFNINLSQRLSLVFSWRGLGSRVLRQSSMLGFELCPWVKTYFLKKMIGLQEYCPTFLLTEV